MPSIVDLPARDGSSWCSIGTGPAVLRICETPRP
jgi:hypothetical protein